MEQLKFSYIVGGTVHWYNHCGKFAASTKKQHPFHTLKPSNSMSKYSPNNAFAHENMYKNKLSTFYMFINIIHFYKYVSLFIIAPTWKRPKLQSAYTGEYHIATKKNKLLVVHKVDESHRHNEEQKKPDTKRVLSA